MGIQHVFLPSGCIACDFNLSPMLLYVSNFIFILHPSFLASFLFPFLLIFSAQRWIYLHFFKIFLIEIRHTIICCGVHLKVIFSWHPGCLICLQRFIHNYHPYLIMFFWNRCHPTTIFWGKTPHVFHSEFMGLQPIKWHKCQTFCEHKCTKLGCHHPFIVVIGAPHAQEPTTWHAVCSGAGVCFGAGAWMGCV